MYIIWLDISKCVFLTFFYIIPADGIYSRIVTTVFEIATGGGEGSMDPFRIKGQDILSE